MTINTDCLRVVIVGYQGTALAAPQGTALTYHPHLRPLSRWAGEGEPRSGG